MPVWLRAVVFVALFPAALAGWIPWLIGMAHPAAPGGHQTGLVAIALGWGILLWCARDFARRGRGTPAPYDPPRALVTTGVYGIVRNPMYVGVLVAIAGWALWFWSLLVAIFGACAAIAFHARVVSYEEPVLTRSFGADFAAYRARVPRWLPGFKDGRRAHRRL